MRRSNKPHPDCRTCVMKANNCACRIVASLNELLRKVVHLLLFKASFDKANRNLVENRFAARAFEAGPNRLRKSRANGVPS